MGIFEIKKFKTFLESQIFTPSLGKESDSTKIRESDSQRKLFFLINNISNIWKWFHLIKILKKWITFHHTKRLLNLPTFYSFFLSKYKNDWTNLCSCIKQNPFILFWNSYPSFIRFLYSLLPLRLFTSLYESILFRL